MNEPMNPEDVAFVLWVISFAVVFVVIVTLCTRRPVDKREHPEE